MDDIIYIILSSLAVCGPFLLLWLLISAIEWAESAERGGDRMKTNDILCPTCQHQKTCKRDDMIACSDYKRNDPNHFTREETQALHHVEEIENNTKKLEFRMTRLEKIICILIKGGKIHLEEMEGWGITREELDSIRSLYNEIKEETK